MTVHRHDEMRSPEGFGVAAANIDGPSVCRIFNRAIAKQSAPKHLSSDHDPLSHFQRWLANLRILELKRSSRFLAHPGRMLSSSG
jgi:hypothetical protein